MLMSKSLAASFLMTLKNKFIFSQNASGIKLCIGSMPTDAELDSLTQASSRILDNVTATIDTTGLVADLRDTNWPPQFITKTLPTVQTAVCSKTGKIGWCVFYHATSNIVVIGDVTKTNGGGIVTVNEVDVTTGQSILFTNLSIQAGR